MASISFADGYGLSYTRFEYANLRLASSRVARGDTLRVSVDLTNTGPREADEVTQRYVRDLVGSLTRPVGAEGVRAGPAPSPRDADAGVRCPESLGFHGRDMRYVVEPGAFRVFVGGDSRASLEAGFEVTE